MLVSLSLLEVLVEHSLEMNSKGVLIVKRKFNGTWNLNIGMLWREYLAGDWNVYMAMPILASVGTRQYIKECCQIRIFIKIRSSLPSKRITWIPNSYNDDSRQQSNGVCLRRGSIWKRLYDTLKWYFGYFEIEHCFTL